VNPPAGTSVAEVIFPSGSAIDARLSQEAANTDGTYMNALMASTTTNRTKFFNVSLLTQPHQKTSLAENVISTGARPY
jgi:hypothetical protein